jgi:hypothetical protein
VEVAEHLTGPDKPSIQAEWSMAHPDEPEHTRSNIVAGHRLGTD